MGIVTESPEGEPVVDPKEIRHGLYVVRWIGAEVDAPKQQQRPEIMIEVVGAPMNKLLSTEHQALVDRWTRWLLWLEARRHLGNMSMARRREIAAERFERGEEPPPAMLAMALFGWIP
jgi:hypothetical protein